MLLSYTLPRMICKAMPQISKSVVYTIKLKFDGCSRGNPGLSGAGAVLYNINNDLYTDKEVWSGHAFIGEQCTNNYAEYSALILGLDKAKELQVKDILVEGDSLLVINQMKSLWKCHSPNIYQKYIQAKAYESFFDSICYTHIPRSLNCRADELANTAVDSYLVQKKEF
jgi:ribonuclease HI